MFAMKQELLSQFYRGPTGSGKTTRHRLVQRIDPSDQARRFWHVHWREYSMSHSLLAMQRHLHKSVLRFCTFDILIIVIIMPGGMLVCKLQTSGSLLTSHQM